MTEQSPFGDGGFDMSALLAQAQQMQEQMMSAQQQLADATVQGTVADGLVTVTVNGTGELVGASLSDGLLDDDGRVDLRDVEDLLVAAYRDAKTKAEALAAETLGPLAGGLGGLGGAAGDEAGPGAQPGHQLGF